MKTIQIRCSKTLKTRKGRQVKCSAFIANINDYEVAIKCRNCGTWYLVSRDSTGKYNITGKLPEKYSENLKKEPNDG